MTPNLNRRPLSPQQVRVVDLIAAGLSNKEIAGQMGLVEGTVKVYISRSIFRKLGVRTRHELISRYWQERTGRCFACGAALIHRTPSEIACRTPQSPPAVD